MKRNDIKALHQKTVAELEKMLNDLSLELAAKRLMKKAGRLENVSEVKTLSDDIARVKTIIGEKKTK